MDNKEIELTNDLMISTMDSNIESSRLNLNELPSHFICVPEYLDDSEKNQSSRESKERQMIGTISEKLYGKTIDCQKVNFLPFFLFIVINRFIFYRACAIIYHPNSSKIEKIYTTYHLTKQNAERQTRSIMFSLQDRGVNHEIFYALLNNKSTRDETQDFLMTFPPDFPRNHREHLNKQYQRIVRANSDFATSPLKGTYIVTRVKRSGLYETFVSGYDELARKRYRLTPSEPYDKSSQFAFEKFDKYQEALVTKSWRKIYPLDHLWAPDFRTDCVKFQDITKFAKNHEEPQGLKAGDIILFEASWIHFDAGIILKEVGETRYARFERNARGKNIMKLYETWSEFVGAKENVTYVLRMFNLLTFDTQEQIMQRSEDIAKYEDRNLFFSRIYHLTPAEFIAYGEKERKEAPRRAVFPNNILRFIVEGLLFEENDEETKFNLTWGFVKIGGYILRNCLLWVPIIT